MGQKLNRSQPSMFDKRKRKTPLKIAIHVLLCIAVVAAGFFSAKWITEGQKPKTATDKDVPSSADASAQPSDEEVATPPSEDKDVVTPEGSTPIPDTSDSLDRIRAFYLPLSALSADTAADLLHQAYTAGFNAVVFDLKDAEGNLYYQFTSPEAKQVKAYTADALTADQLTVLFDLIRENGLYPIPRLYAFRDNVACGVLTDARISYVDNHSWAWYDGVRDEGAKKWLNPYSDTAQDYIQGLVTELKELGAPAILLEGVQFPDRLDKNAYLGDKAASVSKSDILAAFVEDTRTALGADVPLLLGCTAESALGTETKVYGGNPLTFAPTFASPSLTVKIEESVGKMVRRIQVLEAQPALAPTLPTEGLTPEAVQEAISACVSGGADSFILYHPDGTYDFAAYTLP